MICSSCMDEIVSLKSAWIETIGWARMRDAGGTNALALRTNTGRLMCEACMSRAKAGPVVVTLWEED